MANTCSVKMPQAYVDGGGSAYTWLYSSSAYGGISPPPAFVAGAGYATTTEWLFDADSFGIYCQAFSNDGSVTSVLSQASAISALQSADVGLQAQITAIAPFAAASDAGGYITPEIQLDLFWAVASFLLVVYLADRVRRFFWRSGGDHA